MNKIYKLEPKPIVADFYAFEYESHSKSFKAFKEWCESLVGPLKWSIYRFWKADEDPEIAKQQKKYGDVAILETDFDVDSLTEKDDDCEIHFVDSKNRVGSIFLEPRSEAKRRGFNVVVYNKLDKTFVMDRKSAYTKDFNFKELKNGKERG